MHHEELDTVLELGALLELLHIFGDIYHGAFNFGTFEVGLYQAAFLHQLPILQLDLLEPAVVENFNCGGSLLWIFH